MNNNKIVLVVAAHADDEVLGCGGTIINHTSNGDKVHTIFMADGVSSRSKEFKENLKLRKDSSKLAQSILGISSTHYIDLADNRMDSIPTLDIVQKLEPIIDEIKPSIIYTHHPCDLNIDHQLTHTAVMTACRPIPNIVFVKYMVLKYYRVPSGQFQNIHLSNQHFLLTSLVICLKS